jgi:hypothetical protein
MRRALVASCAALLLASCAFGSERALFDEGEAVRPFADGAEFQIEEHPGSGDLERLVYRSNGAGYDVTEPGESERPLRVLFVPIAETPEEDYIAQVRFDVDDPATAYAFLWRRGESYRILAAPGPLEESSSGRRALERRCTARPNSECALTSPRAVIDLYLEAIYEPFVRGGMSFHGMMEQTPVSAEKARNSK